jgi:GntR family transcriptional regulator
MNALLPIYYQIKQSVKNSIISGVYGPGDKIPSENELADQFKVSRLTARQALQQLMQEGFLVCKRGVGTFVTGNTALIDSFNLEFSGFMDDLFYQVSKSTTKSVEIARIVAPGPIKEKLGLSDADSEIVQVKRVRFKEEKSFAYTVNYIPLETGLKLTKEALFKKPLLQIMEQDLGITFSEAFQTIEATFADQELAEKLEVPGGSPILFVERIMYAQKQKPIEVVQSSYRGDVYKYIVRLKNVRSRVHNVWVHQSE